MRPQGLEHVPDVALHGVLDGRALPSPLLRHPLGQGVMDQRHDGLDATLVQRHEDVAVVVEGLSAPAALLRLDAAPLDGEAVRVVADGAGEIEVGAVAVPVVACVAARDGDAARLLPRPPVVVVVPALNLVGGGRGAPQEPGREAEVGRAPRRLDGGRGGGRGGRGLGRSPRGGLGGGVGRELRRLGRAGPSRLLLHGTLPGRAPERAPAPPGTGGSSRPAARAYRPLPTGTNYRPGPPRARARGPSAGAGTRAGAPRTRGVSEA